MKHSALLGSAVVSARQATDVKVYGLHPAVLLVRHARLLQNRGRGIDLSPLVVETLQVPNATGTSVITEKTASTF